MVVVEGICCKEVVNYRDGQTLPVQPLGRMMSESESALALSPPPVLRSVCLVCK